MTWMVWGKPGMEKSSEPSEMELYGGEGRDHWRRRERGEKVEERVTEGEDGGEEAERLLKKNLKNHRKGRKVEKGWRRQLRRPLRETQSGRCARS